jgi:HEAT repeat protein
VTPDGEVISRKAYFAPKEELLQMMAEATLALSGSGGDVKSRVDAASEKKMKELREKAKTRDWEKQYAILKEVESLGKRPAHILFTEIALDKKYAEDIRKNAISRLGVKGDFDSLDTLLKLVKDDDTDIVIAAASALEVLELPAATESILKLLKKKPSDVLRCTLLRTLGACGGDLPEVRSILYRGVHDSNAFVRCSAALGLGYILDDVEQRPKKDATKSDREALDALLKVLSDTQWTVRGAAVYALGDALLLAHLALPRPCGHDRAGQGKSENQRHHLRSRRGHWGFSVKGFTNTNPAAQEWLR